ncbi:G-protein coupled receptor Mth-like [Saccostrea cucullata]|uniref:G-protein coupled receptor Mth-like n=1 Tax=Saccostrea cuccullata TaxID=36930 RepID=UPI002ED1ECAF
MDFYFSNDELQIFVPILNRAFYHNQFSITKGSAVRICASDYMSYYSLPPSITPTLNLLQILTIISTSVSLVSLVITFTMYCILKNLRSIPGQNLMCFVFSLFFAQLFTLIKSPFTYDDVACTTVGILTYYFWLSTFTCATSSCIHMFRVFACDAKFNNTNPCNRIILAYIFFSYLTPLVLVSVTIGFQVTFSASHLTGFGGTACFIDGGRKKLLIFIIPISVFCFVNVILFSVTFSKIQRSPKIENGPSRNYLSIYLKLFLLTGLTWIFQIIDGLFEISPFSYLVSILNGSQGLCVMISFVFNERVRRIVQEMVAPDTFRNRKSNVKTSCGTDETPMETPGLES